MRNEEQISLIVVLSLGFGFVFYQSVDLLLGMLPFYISLMTFTFDLCAVTITMYALDVPQIWLGLLNSIRLGFIIYGWINSVSVCLFLFALKLTLKLIELYE